VAEALLEVSKKGLGMTGIVDDKNTLVGVFTDGDLRRILDARLNLHTAKVAEVMTEGGKVAHPEQLAVEAINVMETFKISALMVVDEHRQPLGAFNMHMLLKAGVL